MLSRIKQYILIALGAAAFYFLLSHHIIFYGIKDFDILKKQQLTLDYTFYSLKQANPYEVLKIKPLRDAGIENIMLERGMVSQERLDQILEQIDKAD
jgi:hypothetical protein